MNYYTLYKKAFDLNNRIRSATGEEKIRLEREYWKVIKAMQTKSK